METWSRRLIKHLYWAHFYRVRNADTSSVDYQTAKQTMLSLYRQGRTTKEQNPRYRGPASEWTDTDRDPPSGDYVDIDTDAEAEEASGSAAAAPASSASGSSLPVPAEAEGGGAGGASAAANPESKRRKK